MNHIILALILSLGLVGAHDYFAHREIKSLGQTIITLEKNEATYKTQLKEFESNNTVLAKEIENNNKKISGLVDEAKTRERKAEEARQAARIAARSNVILSNQLLNAKPKSDDLCKEANDLFNTYIDKRGK